MLKKLYGIFIYKLQTTSFFSIMERISGFLLLCVLYYFFLAEVLINSFFFTYNLNFFFLIISFFTLFFLSFHVVNGIRIYVMSLYYYINLKKKPLILETLYSFLLIENNKFFKFLLLFIKNIIFMVKSLFLKSNYSFLLLIFLFYFILIFIFLF
jgi:succinate dehydrogenase/fumarate reductase cytochrome b subunit